MSYFDNAVTRPPGHGAQAGEPAVPASGAGGMTI